MKTDKDWIEEEKRQAAKYNSILKYVKSKVSDGAYKEILDELKECWCTYHYEIVKTPEGKMREHDEYDFIEGVYVNQTTNGGYSGDDFAGTCAIKISDLEKVSVELIEVETIPKYENMEFGKIYYSEKYEITNHLCLCGCGFIHILPIKNGYWEILEEYGKFVIKPSIYCRNNKIRYLIFDGFAKFI